MINISGLGSPMACVATYQLWQSCSACQWMDVAVSQQNFVNKNSQWRGFGQWAVICWTIVLPTLVLDCFFHLHRSLMVISWNCLGYLQMGGSSLSVLSCRSCRNWKYIPQTSFQLFPSEVLVFLPSCTWGSLTLRSHSCCSLSSGPASRITQSTELPRWAAGMF